VHYEEVGRWRRDVRDAVMRTSGRWCPLRSKRERAHEFHALLLACVSRKGGDLLQNSKVLGQTNCEEPGNCHVES
jgi:hypothetical protein